MSNTTFFRGMLTALASVSCLMMVSCTGSTGGSEDSADYQADTFSANESNTGGLTLTLNSNRMSVSQTSGFFVSVTDANGGPVPNINISCDTEQGLALIEPNTGSELTDGFGQMSGIVGCAAPGSFQMACRLPIGANSRKFASVVCEGATPEGFSGFEGAGGGGLFGGVDTQPDGTSGDGGLDGVVITRADFLNNSGGVTSSIDITQDVCTPDDPSTPDEDETECEPFTDGLIEITVTNNTNQAIELVSYDYVDLGTGFVSSDINLNGTRVDAEGGETKVSALFADATGGGSGSCPAIKVYNGATTIIPAGFNNIRLRVTVRNDLGDTGVITTTIAGSFDGFDNCA